MPLDAWTALITNMPLLNPSLYAALTEAFPRVTIKHAGVPRVVRYMPDYSRGVRLVAKPIRRGETYVVDCPFCGDRRQRLYVNHAYGQRDPKTGSSNDHLFHCFNEDCHREREHWNQFRELLLHAGYESTGAAAVPAFPVMPHAVRPEIQLPEDLIPIHHLGKSHPAVSYLVARGFSVDELWVRWGVCYCDCFVGRPRFRERIVIPIYGPGLSHEPTARKFHLKLLGWQARFIGEPADDEPKYLTSAGMAKSETLYGLPAAVSRTGPVLICEGVTDVWRSGLPAVALFGKTMSPLQAGLLQRHFPDRPLVVFLDREAQAEAEEVRRRLRAVRHEQAGDNRVVAAKLPPGRDDLGVCKRSEIIQAVCRALSRSADDLDPDPPYRIVTNSGKVDLTKLGDTVAISYAVDEGLGPAGEKSDRVTGIALVGQNSKSQYAARGFHRLLSGLNDSKVIYHSATTARLREKLQELPSPMAFEDVQIMARLLDENRPSDLTHLALRFCKKQTADACGAAPPAVIADAAVQQAALIRELYRQGELPTLIKRNNLEFVYRQIELSVVDPTVAMMANGIRVDIQLLRRRRMEHAQRVQSCRDAIARVAGCQFNPNSPEAVRTLLFDQLGLPGLGTTTDGKLSTDDHALKQLVELDKTGVVKAIQQHRRHFVMLRASEALLHAVDPETQRVRSELDPLGAVTGRFGCRNVPLQSMPKMLQDVFVADDGYQLVEADFSQIEPRVLAHFSREPALVRGFRKNTFDVHRSTAAIALGIGEDHVTSKQRNKVGKRVNFAIIYGSSAHALARQLGISHEEANAFLTTFFGGYPRIASWISHVHAHVERHGAVRTLYGRRRRLPDARSANPGKKAHALRQAVNAIIQGTAADINKLALVRLHRVLPGDCRMLLTVHDSVLLEVPDDRVKEVVLLVRRVLQKPPPKFSIPLAVDIHVGPNWGECKRSKPI
jgi:DNA polymerase I-like protein with 3'-5' exonuclease and polymerase domains